ncbi:MAG: hypothetical protein NZ777_20190, partial [Pseudomonadales bacterium]|nr:hypothetical protein [Pseudomonadales bacterium]
QIRRVRMSENNIETAKTFAVAAAEKLDKVGPVSEVAVFDERNGQEREERSWRCQSVCRTWM